MKDLRGVKIEISILKREIFRRVKFLNNYKDQMSERVLNEHLEKLDKLKLEREKYQDLIDQLKSF